MPLIRSASGLLKCRYCGFSFKPGQTTPLFQGYAPETLQPLLSDAEKELQTFYSRVAQKLVPMEKTYDNEMKRKLFSERQKLKASLDDMFSGKVSENKWFTQTRRYFNRHPVELAQILCDCLAGFKTKEACQFRANMEQALKETVNAYNPDFHG
jgi:hypothetical protein